MLHIPLSNRVVEVIDWRGTLYWLLLSLSGRYPTMHSFTLVRSYSSGFVVWNSLSLGESNNIKSLSSFSLFKHHLAYYDIFSQQWFHLWNKPNNFISAFQNDKLVTFIAIIIIITKVILPPPPETLRTIAVISSHG